MSVAVLAAARFQAWQKSGGEQQTGSCGAAAAPGRDGAQRLSDILGAQERTHGAPPCIPRPAWLAPLATALAEIPRSRSHSVDRMQAYLAQQQEAAPLTPSVDAVAGAAAAAVAEHRGQEVGPGQGAGEAGLPRLLVQGRHTFPAAAERSYQHQTSAPAAFGSAPAAFGSAPADVGSLALAAGRAGSSASSGGRSLASHASTTAAGARRRFTLPAWLQHTFHALQHGEEHAHPDDHIR